MPKKKKPGEPRRRPTGDWWIYALLLAAVLGVYLQAVHFDFVTLDDPVYVTENPHVQAGLTWAGVAWAFRSDYGGQWHPVTWLSHMLDCQLFGLNPGWPHLLNVLIHSLTALLWFAFLRQLTGARWRSALVAFLFALHPLHVESVAWVCERKDVLSGLFWVLTLWAYAAYTKRPGGVRYVLALILFCLGLMSKPMLVTLPLVLLLLDWWPLARGRHILEKIPFFAASVAASVATILVHQHGEALPSFELVPVAVRLENALVSYATYIFNFFWPFNLAVFYPFSPESIVAPAIAAGLGLAAITVFVVRARRQRPYLAVGWFWYGIALLPVIGLVQAGAQSRADRFTYIPMVGLTIALIWGAAEMLAGWPRVRIAAAAVVCGSCMVLTWIQVGYWRDSLSLYRHAILVTSDNYVARINLASVLETRGDTSEAIAQLREAARLRPTFATVHAELGQLLAKEGLTAEAIGELQTAAALRPDIADVHFRLGAVLGRIGRSADAVNELSQGIRLQPGNGDAHYDLAIALAETGRLPDAAREFGEAVRLKPGDTDSRIQLAVTLARLQRIDEAIVQFREVLRIRPDLSEARRALDDLTSMKERRPRK
jgi:Flp pilus assembly protein TadD